MRGSRNLCLEAADPKKDLSVSACCASRTGTLLLNVPHSSSLPSSCSLAPPLPVGKGATLLIYSLVSEVVKVIYSQEPSALSELDGTAYLYSWQGCLGSSESSSEEKGEEYHTTMFGLQWQLGCSLVVVQKSVALHWDIWLSMLFTAQEKIMSENNM